MTPRWILGIGAGVAALILVGGVSLRLMEDKVDSDTARISECYAQVMEASEAGLLSVADATRAYGRCH